MNGRLSKSRPSTLNWPGENGVLLARRSGVLLAPSGLDIDFSVYRCGPGLHQAFTIRR